MSILLALAAVLALQGPGEPSAPFARVPGLLPAVELHALAAAAGGRARSEAPVVLRGVALPGGGSAELRLRPMEVLAPGARAVVVGARGPRPVAPTVRLLAGRAVAGSGGAAGGGRAFLAVTPRSVSGFVELDGRLHAIADPPTARALPDRPPSTGPLLLCGAAGPEPGADAPDVLARGGPVLRVADVFFECDPAFRGLYASDVAAVDAAVALIGASSAILRRDVGLVLRVPDGWLRVWNVTPPWGPPQGNFFDLLALQAWWSGPQNPQRDLDRALVHLLTAPSWGGVAWQTPGVCDPVAGYAVSALVGKFPLPLKHASLDNGDVLVLTHELGHGFGSPHTFDYVPPIPCVDGSGPDGGTLMGGCHLLPGGVANVGMRFHPRVQDRLRRTVAGAACLEVRPLRPGDWDADGDVDRDDLEALLACAAQGFESAGCTEVFDLDGDGRLTARDVRLLEIAAAGG